MGLFSRSAVDVIVTPAVVTPRETVQASVTTGRPLEAVRAARLEWGYTNFFNYHWAGRADSAMAKAGDAMWYTGNVGTSAGGDRDTDEWVGVTTVEIPLTADVFDSASSSFTVPSWAPASSEEIARWSCRLTVERSGRDVEAHGVFTVVTSAAAVAAEPQPTERVAGDGATLLDIDLDTPVVRAGAPIRGRVTLTPTADLPDGDLAVCWQRRRASHPLTQNPSNGGSLDGRIVQLAKRIPLRTGRVVTLPFEIPLAADVPPTAEAVHSSMAWFAAARLFYAGFSSHSTERVVQPVVVVNAP